MVKALPASTGDVGSSPTLGRSHTNLSTTTAGPRNTGITLLQPPSSANVSLARRPWRVGREGTGTSRASGVCVLVPLGWVWNKSSIISESCEKPGLLLTDRGWKRGREGLRPQGPFLPCSCSGQCRGRGIFGMTASQVRREGVSFSFPPSPAPICTSTRGLAGPIPSLSQPTSGCVRSISPEEYTSKQRA